MDWWRGCDLGKEDRRVIRGSSREAVRGPGSSARRLLCSGAMLAGLLLFVLGGSASAQPSGFGVQSASLTQDGRQLQWSVKLDHSFSGAGLQQDNRSLCLLIERRTSGSVVSQLCVAPPGRARGTLGLKFAKVTSAGPGAGRPIAAVITRHSASTLTASFTPASIGLGYRSLRWQVKSGLASRACTAGGQGTSANTSQCTLLYPSRPALARLHTPLLVGCAASGQSLVFGGSTQRHEIALTFDDGPWDDPPTIDFVNLLARYHVPATFFEIGDQIATYDRTGSIERRMLADGDMIGDHTWTHPDMVTLSPTQQTSELDLTASAIRHATGFTPCLWRPPYGDISDQLDSLARSLGFLTIYWNIDPRDWSLPGVGSIESTVLDNARNGGIVEMHFGGGPRQETLSALPTMIGTLRKRGYRFVTVAQMLGLRMIYK
jgi:peptidoglycan-N-acetylglucosamine deacetylase